MPTVFRLSIDLECREHVDRAQELKAIMQTICTEVELGSRKGPLLDRDGDIVGAWTLSED